MKIEAKLKKTFLYGIAATLAVSAALAVAAVLLEGLDPFWRHVQATALVLGAGSILGLAFAEIHARGVAPLGAVGMAVTLVAAALALVVIWMDAPRYDPWGKLMATATFAALALAAVGLMALTKLTEEWYVRVRRATSVVIALLLALAGYLVWTQSSSDWVLKPVMILWILTMLGIATVFILHFVSRMEKRESSPPEADGKFEK